MTTSSSWVRSSWLTRSDHLWLGFLMCAAVYADKVDECCRSHNIPDNCVQTLCYPLNPPGDFAVYDIFQKKNNCSKHLPQIAQCLSDGRDHSHCCRAEAKDRDETACFGLCEGSGLTPKGLKQYQTCLAINLPAMFGCFQRGYEQTPSRPTNVRADEVDTTSTRISWDAPEHNADKVSVYLLHVQEKADDDNEVGLEPKSIDVESKDTQATINDLEPGTAYEVTVVAVGKNPDEKSLATTPMSMQTNGISPRIHSYKDVVYSSKEAPSVVLACSVHMSSISKDSTKFDWFHKSPGGALKPLSDSAKFNISYYVFSYERPREYVTTLEIKKVTNEDFGLYQCQVADKYGTAESEVQLALGADPSKAADQPPSTPLECCKARDVEPRCLQMCGAGHEQSDGKRYIPRPFMPTNCSAMISKVLSCAMPGVNDGACCLSEHVPRTCMYLCDSTITPTNQMDPMCIPHMAAVERCRVQGVARRPSVPLLKVEQQPGQPLAKVQWENAAQAVVYHLFSRAAGQPDWDRHVTKALSVDISGADELVLVAANTFGLSQAARLRLQDGKWSRP